MSRVLIYVGEALDRLRTLPDESVHAIVTSPPYWRLRDYGEERQLGLEDTPQEYVDRLVAILRDARRVLRHDGTLWLNLGDSYASENQASNANSGFNTRWHGRPSSGTDKQSATYRPARELPEGFKRKDLVGVPWMVAFALRADGWWLRSDCVWSKNNCMPSSVTDRPTTQHEYVFLLAKSEQYFFDMEAVREPHTMRPQRRPNGRAEDVTPRPGQPKQGWSTSARDEPGVDGNPGGRNMRTVWSINPRPFRGAHFATFPPELPERCVKASTSEHGACASCGAQYERVVERGEPDREQQRACGGDADGEYHGKSTKDHAAAGVQDASAVKARILAGMRERRTVGWEKPCDCRTTEVVPARVLDPFGGAGTTGLVAARLQRDAVLIELKSEYADMARERIAQDSPMFNQVEVIRE